MANKDNGFNSPRVRCDEQDHKARAAMISKLFQFPKGKVRHAKYVKTIAREPEGNCFNSPRVRCDAFPGDNIRLGKEVSIPQG